MAHAEMVASRALVFRPLVKGNEDSGNEIAQCLLGNLMPDVKFLETKVQKKVRFNVRYKDFKQRQRGRRREREIG